MKYWIKFDNGETFEGHEGHLADCFGLYPSQVPDFCKSMGWSFWMMELTPL